ncbi:MAG: hypothetical protein ACLGI6_18655, partial [Gammaproteobacteria bacterium]
MLTVINRYTHGYVAVPVILACKSLGLFSCLEGKRLALDDISAVLKGTSGFLFVALRLLESMQWIERDSAGRYALCTLGQRELANVPEDVTTLFDFPFDAYLAGDQRDPGGPSEGALTLAGWVDRSLRNWDSSDPLVPYLLDGMLIIPLLLGLQRSPAYDAHARSLRFEQLSEPARTQVLRLFGHKGWCEDASGAPALTDIGKFMLQRSMNAGTVVSYTPMLRQIGSLLAGDPASVFRQDEEGHELHVERTLNVVSSGFQHERYFRSMDEIFGAIFNQLPVEDQPRYIADVGCGDGTLLRRVHTLLRDTERGKVLDQYPLTLIGVDFNDKALAATAATLHDIDHMVLHGDIGNPSQIEADLARHIEEVDKVLYIRSFLDHDRPFIAPSDQAAIAAREDVGYECVSVAPSGALIPPAVAVQSLVEHLARWARVRTRYGIVILEVHSLPAATTARYLAESENLHFDAYHAFSKQHLVEAPTFLACAAEAGLVFDSAAAKKYPAVFPYTRITLNYFRPKAYRIRMAGAGDLDSLVALERHVPAQWRCDASGIAQRIHAWREGQMVLELDGKVAAAVYARRRSPQQAAWHDAPRPWQHDATGAVVELAYVVGPGAHLRGELLAFMEGYSRTMNGVEQVAGAGACLEFGDETHDTSDTLAQCVASAAERFAASHPIRPEHDTLPAETVLEDFGARWLLGILQARGVLQHPGQCYASADAIGQQIGVLPKYRLLFASLIGIFERKGVLV